jgi:hypothetical protein
LLAKVTVFEMDKKFYKLALGKWIYIRGGEKYYIKNLYP